MIIQIETALEHKERIHDKGSAKTDTNVQGGDTSSNEGT